MVHRIRFRRRHLPIVLLAVPLLLAPATAAAATTPPVPRCTAPYSPDGPGVGHAGYRRSAPAIAWLRAVYGNEADHELRPGRRNVYRSVALRPCALRRGAITVWTTNPPAMIRRAARQPWFGRIDVQWVRVRFGGVDAVRAVRRATRPAVRARIEAAFGGPIATVGDDPHRDALRLGVDVEELPPGADAFATALLGVPTHVVVERQPSPA